MRLERLETESDVMRGRLATRLSPGIRVRKCGWNLVTMAGLEGAGLTPGVW